MIGRFFIESRQRARTRYAVTSDRIIITSGLFRTTTVSLDLRTLHDLSVETRVDGSGTVFFGPRQPAISSRRGFPSFGGVPAFESIADAQRVYNLIREAQQAACAAPSPRTDTGMGEPRR
jgi:hypothetical protein